MNWFWLNIPLAALFFLAWTVIPLWMVIKHPDTGPPSPGPARVPAGAASEPATPPRELAHRRPASAWSRASTPQVLP